MSLPALVEEIKGELWRLRRDVLAREQAYEKELALVHEVHRERARNLLHYWGFRESEQPGVRERLGSLGLDPLIDVEWDVLSRIDRVLQRLTEMSASSQRDASQTDEQNRRVGRELLRERTEALFGAAAEGRTVRIMVTLSADADDKPGALGSLIAAGADCFRINCARDSREAWQRLIEQIRRHDAPGRRLLVFMDLGGSKLRVTSCAGGKKGVRLQVGDSLYISRGSYPARPLLGDRDQDTRQEIAVSEPSALATVLPGHQIWFDDGKIGGVVRERNEDALRVEITYARKGGRKLRLERGMNLPDTPLRLPALTPKDLTDLPFAARHADFLALSFIRTPADVEQFLAAHQAAADAPGAVVIKIETREALRHLPELMLAAMRCEKAAMLLARGDLGVECGMLELPRVQRDVLQYCAAAALPLFWATGVLERMCRTGEPTRAEMTDAVVAARAQCVMLNKGPRTTDALRLLGDLLTRSENHI